jgi:hypothetical protein
VRFVTGPKSTGAFGGGPTITMPPFTFGANVVRYAVNSASVGFSGGTMLTTSPVTLPLVDGDHGAASNLRFIFTGAVTKPLALPGSHPMPRHVNGSRCAFVIPQLVIVLIAQLAAAT